MRRHSRQCSKSCTAIKFILADLCRDLLRKYGKWAEKQLLLKKVREQRVNEETMSSENIVIVSAKRTPMGAFMGSLSPLTATELGAGAIASVIADTQVDASVVDDDQ